MTLKYTTTLQLAAVCGIKRDVPSTEAGEVPRPEQIGIGNSSNTIMYLNHKNIIAETYTLYYGSDVYNLTALTETTHYTLNLTTGKVTLTSAGVTLIAAYQVFAEYSYFSEDMTDSFLSDTLERAEKEVDETLVTTFVDASTTNPSFGVGDDSLDSNGIYNNNYWAKKYPVYDLKSALASDLTIDATSVVLTTGDGSKFPSTGTIQIGTEIITYAAVSTDTLTGCTRGVGDSDAATHTTADVVYTFIVETSNEAEGSVPTYTALTRGDQYSLKSDLGKVAILNSSGVNLVTAEDIPDRVKLKYLYGYDSIPVTITRLTLIYAKRMLANDNMVSSLFKGREEFSPENMDKDEIEMKRIEDTYRHWNIDNV